jgi:hypothetical protein
VTDADFQQASEQQEKTAQISAQPVRGNPVQPLSQETENPGFSGVFKR